MIAGNPFVGLRPFERADAHLFFGRDAQLDALTSRLGTERFVAVLGSSGAGKSSLVRAGLLPTLEGGLVPGIGSAWAIAIMTPGANPIGNLAAALARAGIVGPRPGTRADQSPFLETVLRRGALGLVEAVRESQLGSRPLFIVVDQFEEIFRFKHVAETADGHDHASAFVKLLLEAVRQKSPHVYVMITMRSEFLGNTSEFRDLPEAINDGLFLIPRLSRDQLTQAITGPVSVANGRIATSLVQRLLNDVGDDADQLPVLQHALMRTWDEWGRKGRDSSGLTIDHYEAIKGLGGALSEHADEAFLELGDEQKKVAGAVFKALTERGPDGRDVRRPTSVRELAEAAGVRVEDIIAIVDRFRGEGRSFLMPAGTVAIASDTVLDISHESLMRKWKRLREWIGQEAEDRRIFLRLSDSAAQHAAGQEPLMRDPRLTFSAQWRMRFEPTDAWARRYASNLTQAVAYLDTSLATRRGEDLRRRLVRAGGGLALATLVVGGLWLYHVYQDRQERAGRENERQNLIQEMKDLQLAEADRENADLREQQRRDALSRAEEAKRRLAELLENQREAQRLAIGAVGQATQAEPSRAEEAALVALHALVYAQRNSDRDGVSYARAALTEAVRLLPDVRLSVSLDDRPRVVAASKDNVAAATVNRDNPLHLWRFGAAKSIVRTDSPAPGVQNSSSWASNGRRIVWITGQTLHIWDAETGAAPNLEFPSPAPLPRLVLSPDGDRVLLSRVGGVELWNLTTRMSVRLESMQVGQMTFSGDGRTCVTAVPGALHLWTLDGTPLGQDIPLKGPAQHLAISNSGAWLAAASASQIEVWHVTRDGSATVSTAGPRNQPHNANVTDVTFSPNDLFFASSSDDGSAAIFALPPDTAPRTPALMALSTVRHARGGILHVLFSPDNQYLATGGADKTARLWSGPSVSQAGAAQGRGWIERFRVSHLGPVDAIAFLADKTLVSADQLGLLRASAIPEPEPATTDEDLIRMACSRLSRTLTASEWMLYFRLEPYETACSANLKLDPRQVLEVEIAHAQSSSAVRARQAADLLASMKYVPDLGANRLVAAAIVEARVKNADLARLRLSMARRSAAAVTDPRERAQTEAYVCLGGAISGFAADVVKTCDEAARLDAQSGFVTIAALAYARSGDRAKAGARFKQASQMAVAIPEPARRGGEGNGVCWLGAIYNFAQEVRPACDAAVKAEPDNVGYLDSQGVAYAIIGTPETLKIALANFRAYAKGATRRPTALAEKRKRWSDEIEKGRNPFRLDTRAVLDDLVKESESQMALFQGPFGKI